MYFIEIVYYHELTYVCETNSYTKNILLLLLELRIPFFRVTYKHTHGNNQHTSPWTLMNVNMFSKLACSYTITYVTGPAKINHLNAKLTKFLSWLRHNYLYYSNKIFITTAGLSSAAYRNGTLHSDRKIYVYISKNCNSV